MAEYYEVTPDVDAQGLENKLVNTALTKQPQPYLSGLKLAADISINGLVLNTIDENDVVWVVENIDGWWTLPDPELPDLPRGWGDGSYDAVGRWANRLITLTGSFMPQRPEDAATARNSLMSAVSLVKTGGWLLVYENKANDPIEGPASNPIGAYVRLSGTPQITSVNARGRHNFSIGFKAVDPTKYEFNTSADPDDGYSSTTITSSSGSGSVTINNAGNIAVPVVLELSSGFTVPSLATPPTITNSTYSQSIPIIAGTAASNRLELDTYNREVLDVEYSGATVVSSVNGRAKVSVLVDWIYLEPGDNVIELAGFPTGGTCTIYWRSGWIG
jgi:hypothetical protein